MPRKKKKNQSKKYLLKRERAKERYRIRYRTDPLFRQRKLKVDRERSRERYRTDPLYRQRQLKKQKRRYHTDPSVRKRNKEYTRVWLERYRKRLLVDPVLRERHLRLQRERYHRSMTDPVRVEALRVSGRLKWRQLSPEQKARFNKKQRERRLKARLAGVPRKRKKPTMEQRFAESARRRWIYANDPDFREKVRAYAQRTLERLGADELRARRKPVEAKGNARRRANESPSQREQRMGYQRIQASKNHVIRKKLKLQFSIKKILSL